MKKLDRLELISLIGRELQQRMTYSDIDSYLKGFKIDIGIQTSITNSKWVYVKEILAPVDEDIILNIADELEIKHHFKEETIVKSNDCNFWAEGYFRLFLSHISSFKKTTTHLQKALLPFGISAFVAHKDIEPTKEWQNEIEKALFSMDALVAILMDGFKESNWCDQEVGAALGRNVLIISLRKGMDPYGFLGKYQGLQTNGKNISKVAEGIFQIFISNGKTRDKMFSSIIGLFLRSNNLTDAEAKLNLISSIDNIPVKYVVRLNERALENDMINNTDSLIEKLNDLFVKFNLSKISHFTELETDVDDDLPF